MKEKEIKIRTMKEADYEKVHELWLSIRGFAIRAIDDSKEYICRFIRRNPDTCVVAEADGEIVGAILCGHDGRRASFYHVCVHENYRNHGIGKKMASAALEAVKKEGISKVSLVAFTENEVGNRFWQSLGWTFREELNYYDYTLTEDVITKVV